MTLVRRLFDELETLEADAAAARRRLTSEVHGRYVCTKLAPWREELGQQAVHPAAVDVGDGCSEGCCDDFICPYCGTRWRVEHGP